MRLKKPCGMRTWCSTHWSESGAFSSREIGDRMQYLAQELKRGSPAPAAGRRRVRT